MISGSRFGGTRHDQEAGLEVLDMISGSRFGGTRHG